MHCANLLVSKGFTVCLSEKKNRQEISDSIAGLDSRVVLETGGHSQKALSCGFAVKSPGIPPESAIFSRLNAGTLRIATGTGDQPVGWTAPAGIPVFSEMEIALSFMPRIRLFAVTGTNGKTTTTELLGEILRESARDTGPDRGGQRPRVHQVHVSGNTGIAVSSIAGMVCPGDDVVLEVSSYQLQDSTYFHPNTACLLNITPDHLDHHGGMSNYIEAKTKIFSRQHQDDICVFNALDERCLELSERCPSRALFFRGRGSGSGGDSLHRRPFAQGGTCQAGASVKVGKIVFDLENIKETMRPPNLPGEHNVENAMAAGLMALGSGISAGCVRSAFEKFKGVEHRLEEVAVVKGVRCINDSKATNVDSVMIALKTYAGEGRRIWLIMGGLDKQSPYTPLSPLLRKCVISILTIGQAAGKIKNELGDVVPVIHCQTIEKAVHTTISRASDGDILLLSPACASFDQFRDFRERGKVFKRTLGHFSEGGV